MLVLSRNPGQSVVIGHDVVVTVLEVRGDVVRIGIDAPREVDVHREEIYKELQETNRAAALPAGSDPAAPPRLPTPPVRRSEAKPRPATGPRPTPGPPRDRRPSPRDGR